MCVFICIGVYLSYMYFKKENRCTYIHMCIHIRARKTLSAWCTRLRSAKLENRSSETGYYPRIHLNSTHSTWKQLLKMKIFEGRSMIRTNKVLDKSNKVINCIHKAQTAEEEESEHQHQELESLQSQHGFFRSAVGMPAGRPGLPWRRGRLWAHLQRGWLNQPQHLAWFYTVRPWRTQICTKFDGSFKVELL